jgi:hypothetical protein
MPRLAAPADHLDPALYVARRDGMPSFVQAYSSPGKGAAPFLQATVLASTEQFSGRGEATI